MKQNKLLNLRQSKQQWGCCECSPMQIRRHQPHFQYSLNSLLPLRPHTVHRALSATWLTVVSGRTRFSNFCTLNALSWPHWQNRLMWCLFMSCSWVMLVRVSTLWSEKNKIIRYEQKTAGTISKHTFVQDICVWLSRVSGWMASYKEQGPIAWRRASQVE